MNKTVHQILSKTKDDLEDEILSCLSNLNILQNFTVEELGISNEAIETESEKEAERITRFSLTKQRIEYLLTLVNDEGDDDINKELIFKELPWLQEQFRRHPSQNIA